MTKVTAKAKVADKAVSPATEGNKQKASLVFGPDYTDGTNKEWADVTPHLDFRMTVVGDVCDLFNQGDSVTVTFEVPDRPKMQKKSG